MNSITVAAMIDQLREMPQDATVVVRQMGTQFSMDIWLNTVQGVARGDVVVRVSDADDDERNRIQTFVSIGC